MNLSLINLLSALLILIAYHPPPNYKKVALKLCRANLLVDSHIDLPDRLSKKQENVSIGSSGQFDYEKARRGGLNVAFMSIYVSSDKTGQESYYHANVLIDLVQNLAASYPDKFALAYTVADVRKNFEEKKISLPMGMENGTPLNGLVQNLDHFYGRGIRYITLCHFKSNEICDSSTDTERPFGGLSPFGEQVVHRMNDLGIMVDVSHVSDPTIEDVLRLSKAPVIASHSSCKAFTPNYPRNLSDKLIQKIADKKGVIMVNFGNMFLNREASENMLKLQANLKEKKLDLESPEGDEYRKQFEMDNPITAGVKDAAEHIDHIAQLVGIDYVGFGSDFDGVGPFVPSGLENVSKYPDLVAELLQKGYSDEDIKKICGENFLRVWQEVENVARGN